MHSEMHSEMHSKMHRETHSEMHSEMHSERRTAKCTAKCTGRCTARRAGFVSFCGNSMLRREFRADENRKEGLLEGKHFATGFLQNKSTSWCLSALQT
jgi:hypothetical protein